MMLVCGELEKEKRDRLLPLAPEFCELLETVPQEARQGRVFRPRPKHPQGAIPARHRVGEVIGAIGRTAGIIVDNDSRTGEARKFASAHDLRRAFGHAGPPKVAAVTLMG